MPRPVRDTARIDARGVQLGLTREQILKLADEELRARHGRPTPKAGAMLYNAAMDEKTRTEAEAAAFRRLVAHLRERTDVQNIDLMNLAGFCRNCLGDWFREGAAGQGAVLSKDEGRAHIYGMPPAEWKAKYQREASPQAQAQFAAAHPHHAQIQQAKDGS